VAAHLPCQSHLLGCAFRERTQAETPPVLARCFSFRLEAAPTMGPYCKHDVESPCTDMQQVQQRAASHVERCERAFNRHKDASQGQLGGSI
jgi:hypothetical protein